MTDPVIFQSPDARVDLAAIYAYIGERSPEAALRFRRAAETTFLALARSPGIGEAVESNNPEMDGIRCARITRFKTFLVYYRAIEGGIAIFRVLRGSRNINEMLDMN